MSVAAATYHLVKVVPVIQCSSHQLSCNDGSAIPSTAAAAVLACTTLVLGVTVTVLILLHVLRNVSFVMCYALAYLY